MINITNTSFSRVKVGGKEKAFCVNKLYLVLDIGTTDIKCGCIDANNDMVVQRHRKFPMTQNQQTVEIDFELFFHTVNNLITECLAEQVVKRSTIKALLIISQAQTFAPVDADFRPLRKGIVWLDEQIPPSSEVALKTVKQVDAPQFCAGIIKHYIRILDSHFSQISKMFNLRNIFGSGGMTQSKVWLDILRSTIEHPFVVKNSANAGLFGAITIYNKNH